MEVNNRSVTPSSSYQGIENSPAPINVGDVSSAVIKERTGPDEAKVVLKGQEVTVKFDGPVPSEDRVLVAVKQQNDNGQFVLKRLSNSSVSTSTSTVDDLFKKTGLDPSSQPELREAVKLILSKGGTVTKETLNDLQDFLKNDVGSLTEKFDTIRVMQQKHLEFTKSQLHAINSALHGKDLIESLKELVEGPLDILENKTIPQEQNNQSILERAKSNPEQILALLDPSQDQKFIADMKKALQIQAAGKEQILQALPDSNLKGMVQQELDLKGMITQLEANGVSSNLSNAIQNGQKLDKIGGARLETVLQQIFSEGEITESPLSTDLQETIKLIQKEPSMEKVLDGVQSFINKNPTLDISKIQSSFDKATQMTNAGREMAARKELANAMKQLQDSNTDLQQPNKDQSLSKLEQYLINESVQSLQLDSQNILVSQITKKLSQMAIDFKQVKREMSRNLDTASRLMEGNSVAPVKQMLETTIHKLDQTILKSNFMLYTDMTTEKKMLTASSQLAEAKNQLEKGNVDQANQIVKEVKDVIDKLIFKPSDNRVKHFISANDYFDPKGMVEKAIRPFPDQESGARRIFETVKAMGLTHEKDSAQALVDQQDTSHNLKSMLIQMSQMDPSQHVDQALSNITGQQLLNKPDSSGMQNLLMQLPILLNKQVENVKVFVNSQKKSEKIDWENCSLYFVLESKKLGDVGISISAANRNLSITFKNDQSAFQEKAEPLMEMTKERLQEIGYNVGSLQFKPLNTEIENNQEGKRASSTNIFTEKGYDFTI